jgi:hypothetical protein
MNIEDTRCRRRDGRPDRTDFEDRTRDTRRRRREDRK